MCRTAAILVLMLVLAPVTRAGVSRSWNNVEKLKPGAPIAVMLWNGGKIRGLLVSAGDRGLRIDVYARFPVGTSRVRDVSRRNIRKIVLVRAEQNLPGPASWAKRGAMVGGAAGVGLGVHDDIKYRSSCGGICWLIDGAAGAGLGYWAGCLPRESTELDICFAMARLSMRTQPAVLRITGRIADNRRPPWELHALRRSAGINRAPRCG
jgi:hypothetical protein